MSTTLRVNPADFAPPAVISQWGRPALVVGVFFSVISVVAAFLNPERFFHAWLIAFIFWLGLTLGSLVLLMLQYTSGGNWGRIGRRFWEAATHNLLLMGVCWILIVVGMKMFNLYPWTKMSADVLGADKARFYLNPTFFIIRGIIYFIGWGFLAWRMQRWSQVEEAGQSTPAAFVGIQNLSGAGIVFYGLTITFASVDWVMSLAPEWWSTVFGMLFMVGQCLSTFAFTIFLLARLTPREPLSRMFKVDYLHDFGKLMLAFVVLWAYLSFAQWLVIWSGNIVEEIRWYLERIKGHWQIIVIALISLHFVLPFALLLSRNLKRQARKLVLVALLVLCMRYVDLFWQITPNFHPHVEWSDIAIDVVTFLAIGGLWLWNFFRKLSQRALLPVNDPHFVEMLEAKHG
ncbi:MAG TPA: hypothetical protein VG649_05270 [Candidatus Angelobacter sp.]|jgi:hypothetical protein|nr:hypothetical protein [Candidatus Angelobacter sp.]